MSNRIEYRRAGALDLHLEGRRLQGYAATFHSIAQIDDGNRRFSETILPGAFSASLKSGADILALADHDETKLLARTRNGSLHLNEDTLGLAFRLQLPDTTVANDVLELVRAGLAGGMSFGFSMPEGGDAWRGNRRELRSVVLHEISIVSSWAAYPNTSVAARARALPTPKLAAARRRLQIIKLGG